MNVAHITNIFRASLCLWCKVEDFSFFRYVHRHSAVVAQPVLVFPDSLEFSSQPVHSFVEFPLLEIRLIEERICRRFYLGVPHNSCAVHPNQLLVFRREHPVPVTDTMPVSRGNPPLVLLWVPSFSPSPQQFVQDVVQMRERITCAYGLVVISPTSNLFIQLHNQNILLPRFSSAENRVRDIGNDSLDRLLGRLDNQLFVILSEVPAEEVKTIVNVGDNGLFIRKFQSRSARNSRISSFASRASSGVAAVTTKSSA